MIDDDFDKKVSMLQAKEVVNTHLWLDSLK